MIDMITFRSLFGDFEDVYDLRRNENVNEQKNDTEKLLPCPICGCNPWIVKTKNRTYFVQCVNNCALENRDIKYFLTEKRAIAAWNSRCL